MGIQQNLFVHLWKQTCIGLDKIDIADKGKKQPALWDPLDWKNSVERSRLFVIKAGLTCEFNYL